MTSNLDFRNVNTLVVGLGREGTVLTRFLAEHGALVTVTDAKPASALADSLASLADLTVSLVLGGHPLSLLDGTDIVFVSPGVPLEIPLLDEARRRGVPLSSETRLFTRLCPAPIIGITGSSGKTTTTTVTGEMLKAAGFQTWVGGNIGRPLIGHLPHMQPDHWVVMELSSFQLELFGPWGEQAAAYRHSQAAGRPGVLFEPAGWSPPVAAILNITPNHLDRHPSMAAYTDAKAHILAHQQPGQTAILGLDNPVTREIGKAISAAGARCVVWFSLEQEVAEGAFLRGSDLVVQSGQRQQVVCQAGEVKLLGRHNLANLLAACALAGSAGAPVEAMRRVATTFGGVEHRLELVRELRGSRWYNDSIATTPERTVAALNAFDTPIILLAGGRDKHLPWGDMAKLTWSKVRHLILFGEAADLIETAMHAASSTQSPTQPTQNACQIHSAGTLERAVELAAQVARSGDVVLLSPGGTSYDAYRDFAARGEHYRQLVAALG